MKAERLKLLEDTSDQGMFPLREYTKRGLPLSTLRETDKLLGNDPNSSVGNYYLENHAAYDKRDFPGQMIELTNAEGFYPYDVDDINTRLRRTEALRTAIEMRQKEIAYELDRRGEQTGMKKWFGKGIVSALEEEQFYLDKYAPNVVSTDEAASLEKRISTEYGDVLRSQALALARDEGVDIQV